MIVRIVEMSFREDAIEEFVAMFNEARPTILSFPGCTSIDLLQDSKRLHVFFTYSHWDSEEELDRYRFSEFFRDIWGKTKVLFDDLPQVWSLVKR